VEALERLEKSRAPAVIVHINSPGGTTAGSEQLYDSLMRLKEHKPLVVVVDGLAASGGYITAIAGDYIVAQETSLIGSIGVLFQYPNVGDLLKTLGIKVEEIKSSPLKASPNGFEPTSPKRAPQSNPSHDSSPGFAAWCRRVAISTPASSAWRTGGFSGRQGVPLKLIDELEG
jgi:protease-4